MTGERDKCRGEFEDLRKQRLDQFMSGFSIITNKLKEMYQVRGAGSGTCHMRHALWTGITAKKPGVLGLESPARLEYIGSSNQSHNLLFLVQDHFSCKYVVSRR